MERLPSDSAQRPRGPVASRALASVLLATLAASCGGGGGGNATPPPVPPPPQASDTEAVAYQMSPAHTGFVNYSQAPSFPASPAWNVKLGQYTSYPLIVNGKVYVVSSIGPNNYGVYLYAFDGATGATVWGPVTVAGTYVESNLAYDGGKIFATNFDGAVTAFDAATGAQLWSVAPAGTDGSNTSGPTAVNGIVYVSIGSIARVYALDEGTGAVRWQQPVIYGEKSTPAVTNNGVYVAYPCHYYSFDPTTGTQKWLHTLGCNGGGGYAPVATTATVYIRDDATGPNGQALDALTGNLLRAYPVDNSPAIDGTSMYLVSNGILSAADPASGSTLWSFADPAGAGFVTSPVVINSFVVVGTAAGQLYAVNAKSGAQAWTGSAGTTIPAADPSLAIPLIAMASADHLLVVPTDSGLTAWSLAAQ